MIWIIRLLLVFLVLTAIRSLVMRLFSGGASGGRQSPPPPPRSDRAQANTMKALGREAVKDPQCGIYIDRALALRLDEGGQTQHFCSEKCRAEYVQARRR